MKYSISLFLAAVAVAATSTAFGQVSDTAAHPEGFLHKATPSASPGASAAPAEPGKPLEAFLSTSETSKSGTTEFSTSDKTIYLVWSDGTLKKGDKVRAVWTAEDNGGTKNKKLIENSKIAPGPFSRSSFILGAPASGLPAGKYRADLYENSKLAKTLKFTVKK